MKGFSSKTLAVKLKELQKNKILERKAFSHQELRYRLTIKGQEHVKSVDSLFQWLKKWSVDPP
jgi:DNA-binding HxlR family transcriptional regulator